MMILYMTIIIFSSVIEMITLQLKGQFIGIDLM